MIVLGSGIALERLHGGYHAKLQFLFVPSHISGSSAAADAGKARRWTCRWSIADSSASIRQLAERAAFVALLAPLRKIRWYVYGKRPFAGPEAVSAICRSLHPPRRHRQQPADRVRRKHCQLKYRALGSKAPIACQGRNHYATTVHPPLSSSTSCPRASTVPPSYGLFTGAACAEATSIAPADCSDQPKIAQRSYRSSS